jgi:hypothetical protein
MSWVGFEPTIPGSERAKTVHVLDRSATVTDIFWDIASCIPLKVNRHFRGTFRLHFRGRRISWARDQCESRWQSLIFSGLHGDTHHKIELFICNYTLWKEHVNRCTTKIRKGDCVMWQGLGTLHNVLVNGWLHETMNVKANTWNWDLCNVNIRHMRPHK